MPLCIVRAVQTTDCVPAQWNAWTDTGQYLYLRYRQGRGSVTAYPSPDYEAWDPTTAPLIEWDDETDGDSIDLPDFLAMSGMTMTQPHPTRWSRLHTWLRRLFRR